MINIDIVELQRNLNKLKISEYNYIREDGIAGFKTKSALFKFQDIIGAKRTGLYDEITKKAMQSIVSMPILRINTNKPRVIRYVQWRLGIISDGIFGGQTRIAVTNFQRQHKLNTDGIVGTATWNEIIK